MPNFHFLDKSLVQGLWNLSWNRVEVEGLINTDIKPKHTAVQNFTWIRFISSFLLINYQDNAYQGSSFCLSSPNILL